ncbi:gamma-glutamyl hydrolase-like [Pyxicephalus adspersus]|uniref:gamma-glutamyl hydrolase-like n=1 Tax=Pyxicephalus adspersus TaxID=30357 RepID=UPI003B58D1C6
MSSLKIVPLFFLLSSAVIFCQVQEINDRPIIGIITQEVSDEVFFQYGKTYIADSYVKYLESAGCRVVPIRLNLSEDEYLYLFHSINGVLLPGGAVDLLNSSFSRTAALFYKLSIEAASSGIYFPIWGTCMGFQVLTALTSEKNLLSNTSAENISLPLNLMDDISSSKMFRHAPQELLHVVSTENITANFHRFNSRVDVKNRFRRLDLVDRMPEELWTEVRDIIQEATTNSYNNQQRKEIGTSNAMGRTRDLFRKIGKIKGTFHAKMLMEKDKNGRDLTEVEHEEKRWQEYTEQLHKKDVDTDREVNRFQWSKGYVFPHTENAIWLSQYTANFFVNEARKNSNRFPNAKEEESALIYNWSPTYTGNISGYEMVYFF